MIADVRASSFPLDRPIHNGFLDFVRIDPSGLISLVGWSNTLLERQDLPAVSLDGEPVLFLRHFRTRRPDVTLKPRTLSCLAGVQLDYLVPEHMTGRSYNRLSLLLLTGEVLHFEVNTTFLNPNYRSLLDSPEVRHRDQIYGSGPPNVAVHPHIVELARQLTGPVLDFGCGRGALIAELLESGIEAHGLEIDSEIIRCSIPGERSHLITLYHGSFPSPFPDDHFRSVVCSEVLEHIPDYAAAIKDIARLASERVLFTVPDSSAIPLGFRHGSVPWHLLEATHVNFFNQESLGHALNPYFSEIEFSRIGLAQFNDTPYYVSLAAVCRK